MNSHVALGRNGQQEQIALLDDDLLFLKTCAANLVASGYRVRAFPDPRQALAFLLAAEQPTALILGPRIAKAGGLSLLAALRAKGLAGAVLILTTALQPELEAAAEPAVARIDKTAPFSLILQRLARVIDTHRRMVAGEVTLGPLVINRALRSVVWAGREFPVSPGEFEILAHMSERAGTTVSYGDIYRATESELASFGAAAEVGHIPARAAVEHLRAKFLTVDPSFNAIEHSPGLGYRWRLAWQSQDLRDRAATPSQDSEPKLH